MSDGSTGRLGKAALKYETDKDRRHCIGFRHIVESNKTLRVVGVDDAPFERSGTDGERVGLAGVVCSETNFEGMIWDEVTRDGWDATETLLGRLQQSKFADQIHAVLLDGIAFGGFNVVDVSRLADELGVPCCTVMRERPDWDAIRAALENVDHGEQRLERMWRAGDVLPIGNVYMQICGPATAALWRRALPTLTAQGHIPEAIRLAHLVATAVATGESGRRA